MFLDQQQPQHLNLEARHQMVLLLNSHPNLLNNILSSLGFRSRFDEEEIEKPKRTYADPPSPTELESLKILDGKSQSK